MSYVLFIDIVIEWSLFRVNILRCFQPCVNWGFVINAGFVCTRRVVLHLISYCNISRSQTYLMYDDIETQSRLTADQLRRVLLNNISNADIGCTDRHGMMIIIKTLACQLSCNFCSRLTRTWELRKLSYKLSLVAHSFNDFHVCVLESVYIREMSVLERCLY